MSLSRRQLLGLTGGLGVAVTVGGCGSLQSGQTGDVVESVLPLPEPFRVPLPVPPVKRPLQSSAAGDVYEIVQREAKVELLPGVRTPILGYDGIFPGPTIESRRGRRTVIRHRNTLPVPTSVHLHGGHTPPDSDGFPIDLVFPEGADPAAFHSMGGDVASGSREYTYPMDQRASTLWYHDHRMDFTGAQVYRGLAGFHLVRDDEEDALPLPRGDREIPLMIADRSFAEDGTLAYPGLDPAMHHQAGVKEEWMEGVLGDVMLVNGAPWPELEVDAVRYRFRILNASNARRLRLRLDPAPSGGNGFVQIGSDGGLLARPVRHQELDLAPAERFDVVVDFSRYRPGTVVTMRNQLGAGSTGRVMRFRVGNRASDDTAVPDRLATVEPLRPGRDAVHRTWKFTRGKVHGDAGWLINGRAFDPKRADATPRLGEVEVWRFASDLHHPVHVHLSPFQVLSRGGHDPGRFDGGWKDTVDLRPAEYVDVAVRFTDYRGRYLIHCHNLEHEDMAMMAAFDTT